MAGVQGALRQVVRYEDKEVPEGQQEYLCYFVHRLLDFRVPEVESVAALVGCSPEQVSWRMPYGNEENAYGAFWYLRLPSEEAAAKVAKRSMLVHGMFELWGEGGTYEELLASIDAFPADMKAPWLGEGLTFRINFESYGRSLTNEQQEEALQRLMAVPFKGKVRLRNAQVSFWLIVCHCEGHHGLPCTVPFRLYFGREVGVSERGPLLVRYSLKTRHFIGPTSMDPELALVIANMAKVQKGHFVFDPYVGTGSVLVAASHYGAKCMGADIDVRVVREGKVGRDGKPATVFSNFEQYSMSPPLLLRMDMHRDFFVPGTEEIFHSILADPPYGVRAGARKTVARECEIRFPETHIPSTDPYTLGECLRDLLDFSARFLMVGGRLVYFLPATPDTYCEEEIPRHPGLTLVANSEQPLTMRYSRRLITMEKTGRYDSAAAAAFHAARPDPTLAIDRIHEMVYERFERDEQGKAMAPPERLFDKRPFRGKHC